MDSSGHSSDETSSVESVKFRDIETDILTQSAQHKKRPWSKEEDRLLALVVNRYGPSNWDILAKHLFERTGKQCRERYRNMLDPNVRKGNWSAEEDRVILQMHERLGNQWAKISRALIGRTDNAVKNRWHALTKNTSRVKRFPEDFAGVYKLMISRENKKSRISSDSQDSGEDICCPI